MEQDSHNGETFAFKVTDSERILTSSAPNRA